MLEFQQRTGDGRPHWHILIDIANCPCGRIDLDAAWKFWRNKWHLGGLQLSVKRKFDDPIYAVNYITKYLTKYPAKGYPGWILKSKKRIRFFQGSRSLGPLSGHRNTKASDSTGQERRRRRPMRPLVDRMAECDQRSNVLVEVIEFGEAAPSCRFQGTIDAAPGRLLMLAELNSVDAGLAVRKVQFNRSNSVVNAVEPFVTPKLKCPLFSPS